MAQRKFVDLFCGMGGFHAAAKGSECVLACDICPDARIVYKANYPDAPFVSDVRDVKELPDCDILFAGFPCQPFSRAGKGKAFEDPRGGMFAEILRLMKTNPPRHFLFENVPGIIPHLPPMLEALSELGYYPEYHTLRADHFGVPQMRRRVYITSTQGFAGKLEEHVRIPPAGALSEILGGRCPRETAYTLRVGGGGSGLGSRHNWDTYLVDGEPKRIGVKEGLALMGFPPDYLMPVRKTAAMRLLGNAVVVPMTAAAIKTCLTHRSEGGIIRL